MGEGEIDFRPDVDENDIDRVVSASVLVANAIPMIGSVVGEAIRHAIPNQRADRMAEMLKILDERLTGLRKEFVEQRMRSEEFRDLFEEGLQQSTRAPSAGRRACIASLLKNSITQDELAHEQEETLLSLLGQLNDSELITLGWYGSGPKYIGQRDEYRERHEEVLRIPHMTGLSTDEDEKEAAIKGAYRANLKRLGLAREAGREADEITTLGRLLLDQIDFYSIEGLGKTH